MMNNNKARLELERRVIKRRRNNRLIFLIFIILLIILIFRYLFSVYQPLDINNNNAKYFTVNQGESLSLVAENLSHEGLISNARLFKFWHSLKFDSRVQAGTYRFSPSVSAMTIMQTLYKGEVYKQYITFGDSASIEQMATRWEETGFGTSDDFLNNAEIFAENIDLDGIKISNLNGFLIPATYTVGYPADPMTLIRKMYDNWQTSLYPQYLKLDNNPLLVQYSLPELITLASIIEKEASDYQQQVIIASIFLHRLAIDMPLQSDPTIIYATGNRSITSDDLKFDSPYNTYLYKGLPPGAIANVRSQTILALLNAGSTDQLYFIADKNSELHTASTYEEHLNNINQYGLAGQ